MNSIKTNSQPNPREKANPISKLFYWWTKNLYKKAYQKALSLEDLYNPLNSDRAKLLGNKLEKKWNLQLNKTRTTRKAPKLWKAIFLAFKNEFLLMFLHHAVVELFLLLAIPMLLSLLLQTFNSQSSLSHVEALLCAAALVTTDYLKAILKSHKLFNFVHLGGKMRIAVTSLVYRKSLRLSKSALGETPPGKIVNLIANDVNKFDFVLISGNFVWSAPISILIIGYIIYIKGGIPALIGMTSLLAIIPIQVYIGYLSAEYRQQAILKTDERIQLLGEIISAMQVIKMYAWEKPFCALVKIARKFELDIIRKSSYFRDIYLAFHVFTPRIALYCAMVSMFLFGETLTAEKVFVLLPFYYLLADASVFSSRGLDELSECFISISRVESYLLLDEFSSKESTNMKPKLNGTSHQLTKLKNESSKNIEDEFIAKQNSTNKDTSQTLSKEVYAVNIESLTAKWNLSSSDDILKDVNLKIEKGKLYIVIGIVGSGKSSLFSSILGEIKTVNGSIKIEGNLTYVDQEPWVFGDTIRQNILFGESFDANRYANTVKVCSLLDDFKQLPKGDSTVVGEKGASLSGGQKARINLARAVYRQADIYLLDDPLSAVDARVGKNLFENCITNYLKGKTRILATHQLQYIKDVDGIIHIDQGKVKYYDNYNQFLNDYPDYNNLIATDESDGSTIEEIDKHKTEMLGLEEDNSYFKNYKHDHRKLEDIVEKSTNDTTEKNLLLQYFQSGSNSFLLFLMCIVFIIVQGFVSFNDFFISYFLSIEETRFKGSNINISQSMEEEDLYSIEIYIYFYSFLISSIFVLSFTRSLVYCTLCLRASKSIHNSAFEALIKTSLRFFHTNPSGRILNRFSKDISIIDELLPLTMMDAIQILSGYIGAVIVTCIVEPMFLIIAVVILTVCYWIRIIFIKVIRNIISLEGIARAPVFTHLNETLNGISTIRAYGTGEILKQEFEKFQDIHTSAWYYFISCRFAYGFILKLFNCSFTMFVTLGIVIFRDNFSDHTAGLVITQMLCMTVWFAYGSILSAEAENQLTAVKRLLEYSRLSPESKIENVLSKINEKSYIMPTIWPNQGSIEFKNVYLRYSDVDGPVLKNLNFLVNHKEKIGIVGRTGAGKSSLISALFRLSNVEGIIEIDGVNTEAIPLDMLRSRISIIPQDPVLFSGTLRYNLDPFSEYSDQDMWDALEQVNLKETIAMPIIGLDTLVLDKGSNFSVGQRQLVCLARAVLRKNLILLLDEATANVDPQTDLLIQRTIRNKFDNCTVLTVAHRLNTIIDSDRVMIMDNGHLIEFDHPYKLLQNENSQFIELAKETDEAMFKQLVGIAEQCYNEKFKD